MYSKLNYKPYNKRVEDSASNKDSSNISEDKDKIFVNDLEVADDNIININEKDGRIIRETFEVYKKNGVENTLKVFIRMFSEHPEYKFIWPQFRQIPDSSFILSSALRQHAVVYLGGLNSIIENIKDKQKMNMLIKKIAYAHVKWKIKRSHIQNMLPEILFVLKEILSDYNKETEDAWTTLYVTIANLIENFQNDQKNAKLKVITV